MVLPLVAVLLAASPNVVLTFDGSVPGHQAGEVRAALDTKQNAVTLEPGFTIDDTTRFVVSETEVVLEMRVVTHLLIDAVDADSEADTKVLEKRTSAWLPMIREGGAWRRPTPAPLTEIPAAQLRKRLGTLGPRFAARLSADVEPWSLVHLFEATHELRLVRVRGGKREVLQVLALHTAYGC